MNSILDKNSNRRGLSLLEVLIAIGCLVLILVIALPWMLTARGTSREKICLTRSKAVADAIVLYAEANGNQLPYLVDETGWPVAILPFTDLPGATRDGAVVPLGELKTLHVPGFVCPEDPRRENQKGALSFVVNAGYGVFPVEEKGAIGEAGTHSPGIDWDGDGEVTDSDWAIGYATGVSWRPDSRPAEKAFRMSLPYIMAGDGMEFTLLSSENLNGGNWLSKETRDIGFVIGKERFKFADAEKRKGPLEFDSVDLGPFAINADDGTKPGESPAPSSLHGDYVHAMYVDGHGGPLSEKIDPRAYAGLLTTNGAQYGQGGTAPIPGKD